MSIKKHKIAIVMTSGNEITGGFNYETAVREEFINFFNKYYEIETYILIGNKKKIKSQYKEVKYSYYDYLFMWIRNNIFGYQILNQIGLKSGKFERILKKDAVDVVYFLSPNKMALDLFSTPFITTVWDTAHLEYPYYPEFAENGTFDQREFYFTKTLKKSFLVICESSKTKQNLINYYGTVPNKILDLGFPIHNFSQKINQLKVDDENPMNRPYLIYPASSWSHKNHIFLVEAVERVKVEIDNVLIVFVGSDQGNFARIQELINEKKLTENIFYLGFLDHQKVLNLLFHSNGLVMPTRLGPTNIPPLEALLLGKYSLISDQHETILPSDCVSYLKSYDLEAWVTAIKELYQQKKKVNPDLKLISEISYSGNIIRLSKEIETFFKDRKNWI